MAEFLRTQGISHQITEMIINAQEKLVIISPYLKITENLFERLKEKESENIEIIFVYGKSELNETEKRKLYNLTNLSLYFYKNLHAKCYFNESKMLIASMNLHEFSEKNNREMGVYIDSVNDSQIFDSAVQESNSIIKAAVIEKKANQSSSNTRIKSSKDFEYNIEGDILKWLEKLQTLLKEQYSLLEFNIGQYKPNIICNSFISDNLELQIEPEIGFLRIVFKFNGKKRRDLFYTVHANGKDLLEKSYPEGVVGWGNQMMRVKLDLTKQTVPSLFKYDKNSLLQTMEFINIGTEIIISIINK